MSICHSTKRDRDFIIILIAIFMACMSAKAQTAPVAETTIIHNVRVFDGHKLSKPEDVLIEGGRISKIATHISAPSAKEVDGSGDTLLPGLIDSHVHAWGDALKQALVFGVTTELDMFTDPKFAAAAKQAEAAGKALDQADIRSAVTLVTVPGGHGTEYGFPIPTITTPAEAQAFVDARIAEGSDYIKLVYDDALEYGGKGRPTLSKETMAAVIAAAHKRGKLAVVHIGTQQQAMDALNAGADALVHLFTDSEPTPAFIQLAKSRHAFIIPTLTVLESVSGHASGESLTTDARLAPYLSSNNVSGLKQGFLKMPESLKLIYAEHAVAELHKAGVPILAGTDAPNPGTAHGVSIHRELELLVASGLTPSEALTAATVTPAEKFGLEDRGRIAAGKRADLVLVKGDATTDIMATRDIVAIWKTGVRVDREGYRAAREQDREKARAEAEAAAKNPAPKGSESGLISDFESGKDTANFGAGWDVTTDTIAGGKSTAAKQVVDGGANGSKFALQVTGEIAPGLPYAWGGVMFYPGAQPFAPANLSSKKTLSFWAKGDGKAYRVMLFAQSRGQSPSQKMFTVTSEWQKFEFPIASFDGLDGHDLLGIAFVGGPAAGKYEVMLDEVRVQ